mmetsp:Transcript_76335/g.221628  ORF Transcript_76335/g.221628 Transcript_76335/m.221628 type:complete len:331 (+) Transcript_76335:86-1078(+)|eukprot:CAMPEP_0176053670 /NCGR_PEP_ID=MMETSP0120_2-20121206/26698_1 /TAXON_ID=160619 /ORGANISM="Kryptoperidinium foliaceum, Strain CCMP 1326" /LENGTH=330 /DNA_ID=CAMNT_0017387129 /DNA_START=86 /DNA_END=1078 /DNA_ORIENTATION=-
MAALTIALLVALAARRSDVAAAASDVRADVAVVARSMANEIAQVREPWHGSTVNDLFREYGRIFKHGNRNAASHLWASFLLERSEQMTHERLLTMFSGFCAVSGSPVRPSEYNRYMLTLDRADGSGKMAGFFHYCCWPCVCDTQDFIKVDTRTVRTASGERKYNFAVIGNPCDREEELRRPFEHVFGRGMQTLQMLAPEVRCRDGVLLGAPLSDNGHVIIAMFFDAPEGSQETLLAPKVVQNAQPGRISNIAGVSYQDEFEFGPMCEDRKNKGYNSGMGEIFRKVASISPIQVGPRAALEAENDSMAALPPPDGDDGACVSGSGQGVCLQ